MQQLLIPAKTQLFSETIPAIVEHPITPTKRGRVKCMGKYWPASLYPPTSNTTLQPLEPVVVVGIQKMTLLIRPCDPAS